MAKDDFKNLGFREDTATKPQSTSSGEKGVKGELHW